MIPSSPEKVIENRTKIAQAINMAIGKGRKGIAEEEYETGINFLKKKYMRTCIRGLSPAKHCFHRKYYRS